MKTIKVSDKIYNKIKDMLKEEDSLVKDLSELKGKLYTFWCTRYIYHGVVKEVNKSFLTLENASIVYSTGELDATSASDIQKLPHDCNILIQSIESFQKLNW
jgi:predicted CopG family antitoxin